MQMHPLTMDAVKLFHEGALALADAEAYGMKIDIAYCEKTERLLEKKIKASKSKLSNSELGKQWAKYHHNVKFGSPDQLSKLLFNHLELPELDDRRKQNMFSADKDVLAEIKDSIEGVDHLLQMKKHEKALSTYIQPFRREADHTGILHPFFHLHLVKTYRSSSSNINFQNIPVRDPEVGKLVRSAIMPRDNSYIAEIDYSSAEVKISACNHKDPKLTHYVSDPTTDMHRDVAMRAYCLSLEQMTNPGNKEEKKRIKNIRNNCKGDFTFAAFYGSYYRQIAEALWKNIGVEKLVTKEGLPLYDHLKKFEIHNYADFEEHIKKIDDWFWNENFKVYTKWKNRRWEEYQTNGYFDLLTGFRCSGHMQKNDVLNYPIQGPAFHCLLWSFTRVNNIIKKYNMKTRLLGQVHDSIIANIHAPEKDDFLTIVQRVMSHEVREHFKKWLIVPMACDAEVAPLGQPWFYKEDVAFPVATNDWTL